MGITHQGNTLAMSGGAGTATGTLNADGSFSLTDAGGATMRGVFATEDGRTVMYGDVVHPACTGTFVATKQ
jgi:hypothetical protein